MRWEEMCAGSISAGTGKFIFVAHGSIRMDLGSAFSEVGDPHLVAPDMPESDEGGDDQQHDGEVNESISVFG